MTVQGPRYEGFVFFITLNTSPHPQPPLPGVEGEKKVRITKAVILIRYGYPLKFSHFQTQ